MSGEDERKKPCLLNRIVDYILTNHIWVFLFILIPASLTYDLFIFFYNILDKTLHKNNKSHEDKVKDVQRQVRHRLETGDTRLMCTSRPQWKSISLQKMLYKDRCYQVEINMRDILSLDETRRKVTVEPMVTIGELNDFLIRKGWTVPIVPELDILTIGGLVMGGGVESTSIRHGLFQYICSMYELVLPDGSVETVTEESNLELFGAIPWSYGTLGFLTSVELDIIPYKPYVKLTYIRTDSHEEMINVFEEIIADKSVDSIEGLVYSKTKSVLMKGSFIDSCEVQRLTLRINPLNRWYKKWFFSHAEDVVREQKKFTEIVPSKDFFHRHNRSFFWVAKYACGDCCNHPIFRYLLGWAMPPKFSFLKTLKQTFVSGDQVNNFVCQDFGFTLDKLKDCLEFVDEATKVYPIWLCPIKHIPPKHMKDMDHFTADTVVVDVGVYGTSPIPNLDQGKVQKVMEKYCLDHNAIVALYAETQLTYEEFYQMFKNMLDLYYVLRKKYGCEDAFPSIYEKISRIGRSKTF